MRGGFTSFWVGACRLGAAALSDPERDSTTVRPSQTLIRSLGSWAELRNTLDSL